MSERRTNRELAVTADAAAHAFYDRHPGLRLPAVAVVIPAQDEQAGLPALLGAVPRECCGAGLSSIVIDDGSRDRTADAARAAGAHVASLERGCGPGWAFRLGYRLAREHGARFIVTLESGGRWDPADIPRVLTPVVAGEADLVLGSRALSGHATGARFPATLVRLLTGFPATDVSSGLRAMRAELTAAVRLEQPRHQGPELLAGAIANGYRVAERPVGTRVRVAERGTLVDGARWAHVLLRTWSRDRRRGAGRAASGTVGVARPRH